MTIQQWIEQLMDNIRALSTAERSRLDSYYNELYLDKCDSGMSPSDAIASFGDAEQVAIQLLEDVGADTNTTEQSTTATTIGNFVQFCHSGVGVDNANIQLLTFDVKLDVSLDDKIHVQYTRHDNEIAIGVDNNTLSIVELDQCQHITTHKNRKVRIYLPQGLLVCVNASATCGDISVTKLQLLSINMQCEMGDIDIDNSTATTLTLSVSNGDVVCDGVKADSLVAKVSCGDIDTQECNIATMELTVSNGDIDIDSTTSTTVTLATKSGDIELANSSIDKVQGITLSGDIESYQCTIASLTAQSKSGDIECQEDNLSTADLQVLQGDIKVKKGTVSTLTAKSKMGDIECTILGSRDSYDITASTVRGHCGVANVDKGSSNKLQLATQVGDVIVKFV